MEVLGIDIGGSGVKGAIVETKSGKLLSEKIRFSTPIPSTPKKVFSGIKSNLIDKFKWKGRVGCGFPGVINKNKVYSAANMSKKWVGIKGIKTLLFLLVNSLTVIFNISKIS